MAKQAKVWTGSAWADLASATTDLTPYSTTAQMNTSIDNAKGMVQVVPTSVTKGASGSASVSAGGAVTFSGTESISLNGCFTATYNNYRVVIDISATTALASLNIRFRASGSDDSGNNYNYGLALPRTTGAVAGLGGSTNLAYVSVANSSTQAASLDIFDPQLAVVTKFTTNGFGADGTSWYGISGGGNNTTATQFDGFTIFPNSGTASGTIRIYGYKNG